MISYIDIDKENLTKENFDYILSLGFFSKTFNYLELKNSSVRYLLLCLNNKQGDIPYRIYSGYHLDKGEFLINDISELEYTICAIKMGLL
jgi:hypothetical protein